MSAITLDLPDDLADRLRALADRLPRILELGLRELDASSQSGFSGASDVLELRKRGPSPVASARGEGPFQVRCGYGMTTSCGADQSDWLWPRTRANRTHTLVPLAPVTRRDLPVPGRSVHVPVPMGSGLHWAA